MLKIILCDSDIDHLEQVDTFVKENLADKEHSVFRFGDALGIKEYLNGIMGFVDIVFINLSLADADGLETATEISKLYPSIKIIIFSENAERIEDAFELKPIFFLFKPIRKESLKKCMALVIGDIEKDSYQFLSIANKNNFVNILFNSITYIESDKRKVIIYEENVNTTFYTKLDELHEKLGNGFLRCHKSYLVNMSKIKSFLTDCLLLNDGKTVPVSQKKYSQAKKEYINFITVMKR